MRRILVAVALLLSAVSVRAQQKLVESIEVRVVNVDVVVTDRAGKPVAGLTKDDFTISENGKPQTITNFYEVRPEPSDLTAATTTPTAAAPSPAAPEELRVRRFVLFVDNYSLHPFRRNEILKSLEKFVDMQIRPTDEVEIVLWTRSLSVVTPFTTDRKKIKAGLAALAERSRSGMSVQNEMDTIKRRCQDYVDQARSRLITWQQAYDSARGDANAWAEQVWGSTKTLLEALRLTSTTLAGVEGRKVLVLAGAHMPENPGLELYSYIYQLFSPYMKNLAPAIGEASSRSQTFSIEKLARQANADGVTFYTIDAADTRDFTSAEQEQATDLTEQFLSFTNTAMAYQKLATITGGVAISGTQNFDKAFESVARDLGAYYSLGYRPASDSKGDRRLSVRVTNPAYTVRSRQTWSAKSSEETISDRVIANIYHSNIRSEWPVTVVAGKPEKNGDRFAVPLELSLEPNVTLLPQGEELVGGFNVYIAVGTDNGAMSKVIKSSQPVRIPKNAEAQLRAKPFSFSVTIVVRPGDSTVSLAAVDQISNSAGFARTRVSAR